MESVREIPQNTIQESDQNASEGNQEPIRATGTDSIDPTFLEALPEDLRAEVLSSRQNQVTQTSQRLQQQSQEFEGQPVEMDDLSICNLPFRNTAGRYNHVLDLSHFEVLFDIICSMILSSVTII